MIELTITENDTKSFEQAMDVEMSKGIKHFERELVTIRTGRAHTGMIENVKVSCYGMPSVALKTVAALSAPDARLLTIQPWDASTLGDIEKGIKASDVGLTPINDGKMIRLQLPEMSSTRREELVKILHKKLEECRVAVRNVRKEFNNLVRDSKKGKKISEDFANRLGDSIKKLTDKYIAQAELMSKKKEEEVKVF
ncbi:ribosome recycling factor [bacterium]|nr:ribosome recycling factor [bacterium]